MENFIDSKTYRHFLILNEEKIKADLAYTGIYARANQSIYIVDDDVGIKTFHLLSSASDNVSIIVFSDHASSFGITASIIADFRSEYPSLSISFQRTMHLCHDRYIAIDYGTEEEEIYHCGASSKDAGSRITTIMKVEDSSVYHTMFERLLKHPARVI